MEELFFISLMFVILFSLTFLYYLLQPFFLYCLFFGIALLLPWISYEVVVNGYGKFDVRFLVTAFSPLLFLVLFKIFDQIIWRKYNRRLYISYRGHYLSFRESWLDMIFQLLLALSPLILVLIGKILF